MIEKWRASLDQNGTCAALFKDLSKAFDCYRHDLLIAKLHAYVCDLPPVKLLNSYLHSRHQCVHMIFRPSSCVHSYLLVTAAER